MAQHTFIRVRGAEVYAHHGVGHAERELGGRYSFDLEIEADISAAASTDDLTATVDYERAYKIARDEIVGARYMLLESIVVRVADVLLEQFPRALAVTVCLRKLRPPISGVIDSVEVAHTRRRLEAERA